MTDVVQKLWGFCHTLRHDGIGYTEYVEQLTYLLFLKMADEKGIDLSRLEIDEDRKKKTVDCSWPALLARTGTDTLDGYLDILRTLGKQPGILGDIFAGAQSRFTKPVSLKTLINQIDQTEWTRVERGCEGGCLRGIARKGGK